MFEKNKAEPEGAQSSIAVTSLNSTSRNKRTEPLPQGKPLNKKLVGGVPLIGLATGAAFRAGPEEAPETNSEKERNLELLLLGIGPFEDRIEDSSPIKLTSTSNSPKAKKRTNCSTPRQVSVRLESDSDEEGKCDKKRMRSAEEVSCDLPSKKSLRFDCSTESGRMESSTGKLNRKGTPFKHSRRQIELE